MKEKISEFNYLVITLVLCLVLVFNFLNFSNKIIGISFTLAYILFYSFIFGSIFIKPKGWNILFGLVFLLSLIAILGAGAIYFYQLNDYIIVLIMLLVPALLMAPYYQIEYSEKLSLRKIFRGYLDKFLDREEPKTNVLLIVGYLILSTSCFIFLFWGRTAESIQSPWQVVLKFFIPFYFLATFLLITYIFRSKRTKLPLILIFIHTFLSGSVALIVYKIGYGFDPFIHQATEKIIAQTGTISPTPLYYLGQYAIVIFLHKLSLIDLSIINQLLVPILFSLFIPLTTFYVFSHWLEKKYALILSLAMLIIPFSGFIMTAPQNLANLFFIITIILSMLYFHNKLSASILYFLAVATIAIHPLAGIPLLISVVLLNLFKLLYSSYIKYIGLYFLAALTFIFFLPLAFIASGSTINLSRPLLYLSDFKFLTWINKSDLPLDLAYLVYNNKIFLAGIVIAIGLIYLAKNKLLKNNAGYLASASVILINFIIAKYFLTFPDLRDYDKGPFVSRLANLAFYALLPFFLIGLYWLIKKFYSRDLYFKIFLIFILTGLITISFYFSYPRLNQYEPAKFFSLSASDIKAVNLIEATAQPEHIVLANQMVGVAAIKEFSFKKYYNNQFYYSMPMGTPRTFYDYYLEMIYEGAKKETMQKAMAEAGVNEGYFVLNKYWNNSEKIAKQAAESAEQVYNIDEGKVYIFKYSR